MLTHYYTPRLPFRIESENHNQAKKRRTRALLKLVECGFGIFNQTPVFPYDPNDWIGDKEARSKCQAVVDEMLERAGVRALVISRDIARDIEAAKRKGSQ